MDTWRNMGHMSNLSELEQKRGKMRMREKESSFFLQCTRESERVEREAPTSLYDLRSSVARFSSGQERKPIYATRAMRGY